MGILGAESVLDYAPCHYGASRLEFRGPKRSLDGRYLAFLGGSDVYGRFIDGPLSDHVEDRLGLDCVNLGCKGAGTEAFVRDPDILDIASGASAAVIQVMGAQNCSNRFYKVHPRRNDRFIKPLATLRALYPTLDFTSIHYTRHALQELSDYSPARYDLVVEELRSVWVEHMMQMLGQIKSRKVLFWMGANGIDAADAKSPFDPMFVDRAMVEQVRPHVDDVVEYVMSGKARHEGVRGMTHALTERSAAKNSFGPRAHAEVAHAVEQALRPILADVLETDAA